jgi:hypothetical protein
MKRVAVIQTFVYPVKTINQTLTNSMSNIQVIYYSKCPTKYLPYCKELGLLMGIFQLKSAILTRQEIQIKLVAE